MPKFTVEITPDQKQLLDSLKNDNTNHELFNRILGVYTQSRKSYLTGGQLEYLKNIDGLHFEEHIHLAIEAYIQRLRLRTKRFKCGGNTHKSDHALAKAVNLLETIVDENNRAKSPLNMFFINLSVLKKKSNGSINQAVLQRALYLKRDVLTAHHQKLNIDLNHNRQRRCDG